MIDLTYHRNINENGNSNLKHGRQKAHQHLSFWVVLFVASFIEFGHLNQANAKQVSPHGNLDQIEVSESPIQLAQNSRSSQRRASNPLAQAMQLAKAGKFEAASIQLFQLINNPRYRSQRMMIKNALGIMLYQMKLNQVAAFQFIGVVKNGNNKYVRQALEKLSLAADSLGDDSLLNYALSKVRIDEFPRANRDMLAFRIGEYQLRNSQYASATASFGRVSRASSLFPKAKYMQGLAYAEAKRPQQAIASFEDLITSRSDQSPTDTALVAAKLGKARALYQKADWAEAISTYREVPKDSEMWHDTLFESSWAMLRSGKFRSALSNFHSLHSVFYEDFYLPESLLLRSIVYLYICKYDEMDKVLNLFSNIYKPVYRQIDDMLKTQRDPVVYFNDVIKGVVSYNKLGDQMDKKSLQLPFLVTRKIFKEGDFQSSYKYIKNLLLERRRYQGMSAQWRQSAIGRYARKVIATRLVKARRRAGRQIMAHMDAVRADLFDLFEQEGFIRYEMINGKKEALKKQISGKELPTDQVDKDSSRDYYIQNGYEYWPFRGEYWLDELGNYHYVGTQACR